MSTAHDYSDLHELIDHLEAGAGRGAAPPHALRLAQPSSGRFCHLRTFDGPATDLGARAKDIVRAEIGADRADR